MTVSCFYLNDWKTNVGLSGFSFAAQTQILAPIEAFFFLPFLLLFYVTAQPGFFLSFCQQGPRIFEKVNAGSVQCLSAAHDTVTDPK